MWIEEGITNHIQTSKITISKEVLLMTQNQIRYWSLREESRHNIVSENENSRHNKASESESNRHNVVTEGQTDKSLAENKRHNLVTEQNEGNKVRLGYSNLAETRRHNMAGENLQSRNISENTRHNRATESIQSLLGSETVRHNQAEESLGSQRNQIEGVKAAISGVDAAGKLATNILRGGKENGNTKQKSAQTRNTVQNFQSISGRNILVQR